MPHRRTEPYFKSLEAHVGAKVKAVRLRRGWTQAQVAERAEVTDKFISRVETVGENLSLHSIGALARALEVRPGDLLPCSEGTANESKQAIVVKSLVDVLDQREGRRRQLHHVARLLESMIDAELSSARRVA